MAMPNNAEKDVFVPAAETADRGKWYVIRTLTGYEKRVRNTIIARILSSDSIPVYDAVIPTKRYIEIVGGERKEHIKAIFPGYVLVRAELVDGFQINEQAWTAVRSVQGVLGFLEDGGVPSPVQPEEIRNLFGQGDEPGISDDGEVTFNIGDTVQVNDGPFAGIEGMISEVDNEKKRIKMSANVFGRDTSIELEFWQVERIGL